MAVAFLLYVLAEVAAMWAVTSAVGVLSTVGLLLAGGFLGSWLTRREGGKATRAFTETARSGRSAQVEVTNGLLIGLGGMLIMIPGFVSDLFGLFLLLPPTRAIARKLWLKRMERRRMARVNNQRGPVVVVDSVVVDEPPKPTQAHPVIEGRVIEG